jgi:hypothetical protein
MIQTMTEYMTRRLSSRTARAMTTRAGITPPPGPGDPIAAAPKFPTPAPRNVKE